MKSSWPWVFVFVVACSAPPAGDFPPAVTWRGALRKIMHQGDLSAQARLADLEPLPHLYALGAAAGLRGEVLVLDGQPYLSRVQADTLVTDTGWTAAATLLVYAQVPRWQALPLPDSLSSLAGLEAYLGQVAAAYGLPAGGPFPFRLSGPVAQCDWHVIDWDPTDTVHTHAKHTRAGQHGRLQGQEVDILGFFSDHHQGIFTHHSTHLHLHVLASGPRFAAHVDSLRPGPGMRLYVPGE